MFDSQKINSCAKKCKINTFISHLMLSKRGLSIMENVPVNQADTKVFHGR
jgi:hypothetical protein